MISEKQMMPTKFSWTCVCVYVSIIIYTVREDVISESRIGHGRAAVLFRVGCSPNENNNIPTALIGDIIITIIVNVSVYYLGFEKNKLNWRSTKLKFQKHYIIINFYISTVCGTNFIIHT